jgi:serine/threonine-protein kinase
VVRCLGAGGSGVVFHVIDRKLQIPVALKVIRSDMRPEVEMLIRLAREVKLTRLINHPNVARIHDLNEWEGREFLIMELIDGISLRQRIRQVQTVSIKEGLYILRQLCAGLSAAHIAGIVHCDLKPSNIMLEQTGRVVILDFGIAKWSAMHQSETEVKALIGTPSYMAPEQIESKPIDYRCDIYNLGLIGFEIFTGTLPFIAEDAMTLAKMHSTKIPPDPLMLLPEMPATLAAIILRCLEKIPQKRFSSANEIASMLERV